MAAVLVAAKPRSGAHVAQQSFRFVDALLALRVDVWAEGRRLVRRRVHGGSFVPVSDDRFHFGLGDVDAIDRLAVTWPDGTVEEVPLAGVDRVVAVRRGGPALAR